MEGGSDSQNASSGGNSNNQSQVESSMNPVQRQLLEYRKRMQEKFKEQREKEENDRDKDKELYDDKEDDSFRMRDEAQDRLIEPT